MKPTPVRTSRARSNLYAAIRYLTYPVVLFGAVGTTMLGIWQGFPTFLNITGVVVLFGALIYLLQWLYAYEESWRLTPYDFWADFFHLVVTTKVVTPICNAVFIAAVAWLGAWFSEMTNVVYWPQKIGLVWQLLLALVVGDLGFYLVHRALHTKWLWSIHVLHHSAEKLHIFSSTRTHPFNTALTYFGPVSLLALAGAPADVITLFAVFTGVNGMLQHANIEMNPGPLNLFLATCDYHRFHHSTDFAESNSNFSSNLIVWDVVFRTRYLPKGRRCRRVGIEGIHLPQNVFVHLLTAFRWKQMEVDYSEPFGS